MSSKRKQIELIMVYQQYGMLITIKNSSWKTVQCTGNTFSKKLSEGASLVVQWLRVCLPMQGTRVRALVWEDPTCRGATRPVGHNY